MLGARRRRSGLHEFLRHLVSPLCYRYHSEETAGRKPAARTLYSNRKPLAGPLRVGAFEMFSWMLRVGHDCHTPNIWNQLAEQFEPNPRSVWGYVQGLTRLSQRTPWQDGRFTLDRAASRLLTTVH